MGETFAEIGDIVFSLVIGYISAIEFLYVVRHLYHYSFNHDAVNGTDEGENMSQLQDSMRQQLAVAKHKEDVAGTQVMKDGVPYKDGFRLEAQQAVIDQLKEQLKDKELSDLRRKELEKELAIQMKIAERLRKELAEAEAKYQRQIKQEEDVKAKKLLEEQKKREKEERAKKEAEEEVRRLAEAERQKEAEQKRREEEERSRKEAEQRELERKQREEQERKEAEEQARRLAEIEKQRKVEQRKREEEEEERRRKETEKREQERHQREEQERKEAEEQGRRLAEIEKQKEAEQRKREEEGEERRRIEAAKQERERQQREEQERKEAEEQFQRLAEIEKLKEAEQRKREEEEERRRIEAAKQERERQQHEEQERKEDEEQALRLAEAEKQREIEQRIREEEEEFTRKKEAEQRQHEEHERTQAEDQARRQLQYEEDEENMPKLLKAEKERENQQRELEEEQERIKQIENLNEEEQDLAATRLLAIEHRLEEQLRAAEREAELTDKEHELIASIKQRKLSEEELNDPKEAEFLRKILEAREQLGEESEEEQSLRLIQRERDQEAKQKRIEENALLFMEAEKEMADLQFKMLDAVEKRQYSGYLDSAPNSPVVEEPCIKKSFTPLMGGDSAHSTVKTQLAQQDLDEPYSVRTKPLIFPGVSDDASSIDPASSQKSSFSTQPSEEITTGTDSQYPAHQRQEPDGEDTNIHYSDEYLRSLDGIKQRPLIREDGSGRRRAFKKRRSSNSSNSSRESRQSRDEELKMFTSLEEEEMKDSANTDFTPIRYTTEPTLKVKGHHRRHKRSPAKDIRHGDDSLRSSLERLGEETSDPWGEVKPEHYKHTEFWKREKTLSIDEEMELEKPASSEEMIYDTATNIPSASSFEEATQKQNQEALTTLQKHSVQRGAQEGKADEQVASTEETARSDKTNLETSQTAKNKASPPARTSVSPRLQRSPRIKGINQYDGERLKEDSDATDKSSFSTAQNTPIINVETPLDFGPWRDQYGLVMEGLSDFYDFSASVNPSRSASRNVSPANTAPNTPLPKDVSFQARETNGKTIVEIYDDTENITANEFKMENIIKFIDSLNDNEHQAKEQSQDIGALDTELGIQKRLQYVADDPSYQVNMVPLVNVKINDTAGNPMANFEYNEAVNVDRDTLASSLNLRETNSSGSRSRSKSPLPTPDNLRRSMENRRYKMIKHNEDILEKLIESKLLPELTSPEEIEEQNSSKGNKQNTKMNIMANNGSNTQDQTIYLGSSLQVETRRSRSKSPMRLPTVENLSKGLEKRRNKLIERNDEFIKQMEERSQTPESPTAIVVKHIYERESSEETPNTTVVSSPSEELEEDECSRQQMDLLVQSLRAARSKTKSKSPMFPNDLDISVETSETKTYYGFQHAEHVETTQQQEIMNVPTISINFLESDSESKISAKIEDEDECSREEMDLLIQSLRVARSRSASKSPMRVLVPVERERTPEPSVSTAHGNQRSRHSRSQSPSRSHSMSPATAAAYRSNTPSRSMSPQSAECNDFHVMLNLEGSANRTLSVSTEEQESLSLTNRQRQLDEEALEKLRNASEEMELRTLSPLILDRDELSEQQSQDSLAELPLTERLKLLKKSPTTPDYDRTISEEMRDVERIKKEMLEKRFKRSTYVGESMDLGSEFEPLRRETAKFQRSRSPSPLFSAIESATAQRDAQEKRKIQDLILHELTTTTTSSSSTNDTKEFRNTGAIPKAERFNSAETELSSPHTDGEHSSEIIENFEELRRRNAEFRRSASTSRSPLRESQLEQLASIEVEAAKRVLQDKYLDKISYKSSNLQNFSPHLNADFFDNDRRASDSALINVPKILVQNQEENDLEPEEYHHYRRFSLAQEQPVEQYPSDDYIFIEQVEVRTRSGSRTWLREDFYSEQVDEYFARVEQSAKNVVATENEEHSGNAHQEAHNIPGADEDEDYSNASDDDRQTVVEVDDEIDEDISDFNERGPAEESHHETSECEEAEREMDHYAGREASDWNQTVNTNDIFISRDGANEIVNMEQDEGAVGGLSNSPYDSDSFAIDQIYDEAIKNRKQSGILREYDNILMQMSMNSDIDDQYLMWSKTNGKKKPKNVEFNTQFLDNETEMRYLGDANITARQSIRLRSRHGYNPVLPAKCIEGNDLQVDLNYIPKREYNWRKNFKLDEDIVKEDKEITLDEIQAEQEEDLNGAEEKEQMMMDIRKFSLGGESVTLFSCSPEKSLNLMEDQCKPKEVFGNFTVTKEELKEEKFEKIEKPKKKKTKKKSHKESKISLEETMNKEDEEAYDNQVYCRRSSSIQMDTDSPKRKSHSRRNSKSSVTNEDSSVTFSPRSSTTYNENIADIMEEFTEVAKETVRPKKMKKRKKVKESRSENIETSPQYIMEPLSDIPAVSAVMTPESFSVNILSSLSPQNSVCVTPASIDNDMNLSVEELRETTTASSSTTTSSPSGNLSRTSSIITTPVDTFDILKDANFYPLF